jgi:hypothetical protein
MSTAWEGTRRASVVGVALGSGARGAGSPLSEGDEHAAARARVKAEPARTKRRIGAS